MNSLTVKILASLLAVLMLTTICTQIHYLVHDKHETEEAVLETINEDIMFDGVVIRNEKVLTYSGDGVIDYEYSDGSKVAVNNTIAYVYESEEDIAAKRQIEEIDKQIENLQRAQNPGTTNYIEPESLKKKIETQYREMIECTQQGDYEQLSEIKSELSLFMSIYDIVIDKQEDYEDKINQLKQKRRELETDAQPKDVIKADSTGYFATYADGYETKLNMENTQELTAKDIEGVLNQEASVPENAVGKMFDEYTCKIAGIVKADSRIIQDAELSLMLNTSKNIYDVFVESVKPCEDDETKAIVILTCDRIDENLAQSRVLSAKLIFDEYQGIRVPRSALRFQGEQKGVYVILGKDISFKKVDVIYEGDDYVLSRNTSDEEYLLLYDQILLEVVSSRDAQSSESSDGSG